MENNQKEQKSKKDIGRIATKIVAGILALIMVVAVGATLIYYLVA